MANPGTKISGKSTKFETQVKVKFPSETKVKTNKVASSHLILL